MWDAIASLIKIVVSVLKIAKPTPGPNVPPIPPRHG